MGHIAIGISLGGFAEGLPDPPDLYRYVERADELGIDSIWMPDHVISDSPELEPAISMAVIAARTQDIKMGPSVATLPARNPVEVANIYANLDYLTGGRGRVIMGVGLGNEPKLYEAMGIPLDERTGRLREAIEVLRLLWTEDNVDYDGEYYHLDDVTVEPKPANPLDIWIGGNSDAALRRVAEYGDGWFPASMPPARFGRGLERLMEHCDAVGRHVERDEAGIIVRTHVADELSTARTVRDAYLEDWDRDVSVDEFESYSAIGTPEVVQTKIQEYIDHGCTKFVLRPICHPEDRIHQIERFARDIIPAFDT
ncbi:MAG: LLM class flavin-dependent oxidoreductase [Salinirussus sp.]